MSPSFRIRIRKIQIFLSRKQRMAWMAFSGYLIALSILSLFGERGLMVSHRLWKERQRLDREIWLLSRDIQQMQHDIQMFRTNRHTIERYAREELHLAGDHEIQYIFRP